LLSSAQGGSFREQELLPDFITDIFCNLLGYERPADNPGRYTRAREKYIQVDGKYADAVLGEFVQDNPDAPIVALEGKGPKDPLERPFAGRKKSAVEQGYGYAINLPCDWIIVTSMRQTRLYHKGSDQQTYERFDIAELAANETAFRKFVFLFAAERVVPTKGRCHFYDLKESSEKVGRELTKEFYVNYADIRQDAFETLCNQNPDESRHDLLAATQKLLDRVLFTAFCEDRGLLPADTLKQAFEHTDPYNPKPIWSNFRGLFHSIDAGNPDLSIPPYNGGLFADDPFLESLEIPDNICAYFRDLGEYEYRPPSEVAADTDEQAGLIDVEILGHIFEQSITDLEQIRNELDGLVAPVGKEKHKTRRKKEGAFYTPAFITRYIVEQTLGGVVADRFEQLRQLHAAQATGTAVKSLADPSVYDLNALNKPQREALVRFWEAWQDELATVRVLDPACGSGAFLIEAFDQLHAAYQASNDRLEELRGHRTLFDLDRRILQNNLFGVDLNEEAIQICRLSLWIKTAERGKTLTSLDHTIRVGNSVVDDPAFDAKAFAWQTEFPDVFDAGGFDVVVANPPYIRQEWIAAYKPHWEQRIKSYHGSADIFTYFYELGVELLRDRGRLGYITSGSWVRSNYGGPLRGYLAEHTKIESFIDFGEFQPFEGAEMIRPSIVVLSRRPPSGSMRLFKWLTKGEPPTNLSDVIRAASTLQTAHLGQSTWELESDAVRAVRGKMFAGHTSLSESVSGKLYRGVLTGLTEAFIINSTTRDELIADDPKCSSIVKPYLRGQDIKPWSPDWAGLWIVTIASSSDHEWPWSHHEHNAEQVFSETFPSVYAHLCGHRDALIKRQDKGRYWWELRSCAYWSAFGNDKIIWPDIAKLPRFCRDSNKMLMGNTGYFVVSDDDYLLGILASWATWFLISKTCQPLRLRGDRWQYRLFTQFMERLPIPTASEPERKTIAELARRCNVTGRELSEWQENVRHRLTTTFGEQPDGTLSGKLNNKASEWWQLTLKQLGSALKTSFKLGGNPFQNPNVAEEWEAYIEERKAKIQMLTRQLADAEAELNDRVYRLFELTPDEIKLLQREVEH